MLLAQRLREVRKKNNKTQKEVASHLSISRQAYSKYERHLAEPDIAKLIMLADYFNVSTDYLLGRSSLIEILKRSDYENLAHSPELITWYKNFPNDEKKLLALKKTWDFLQGFD